MCVNSLQGHIRAIFRPLRFFFFFPTFYLSVQMMCCISMGSIESASSAPASPWEIHHKAFHAIIGSDPSLSRLTSVEAYPSAHQAVVFFPDTDDLFISSNLISELNGTKRVVMSKLALVDNRKSAPVRQEIICSDIHMANGGVNDGDAVLFCGQGSMTRPSGLYSMSREFPWDAEPVLTSFYGRPFNSVGDVVFSRDDCMWFTDPPHDFRPGLSMPSQVFRYDPRDESIRAVADGFNGPRGICFSPDEGVVYVADAHQVRGEEPGSLETASTMQVFPPPLSRTTFNARPSATLST